jgi:hypothetical protein
MKLPKSAVTGDVPMQALPPPVAWIHDDNDDGITIAAVSSLQLPMTIDSLVLAKTAITSHSSLSPSLSRNQLNEDTERMHQSVAKRQRVESVSLWL